MIVVARSSFSAMIMLTCVSLIVGAALGQRLTFLVLIPAIGCALAVVAGFGVAVRLDLWSTILAMILTATGLQIGYLAGATFGSWPRATSKVASTSLAQSRLRPIIQTKN